MAIVTTAESETGKEMAKWNKPYRFEPFPQMLYKAKRRPDGVPGVVETNDQPFGGHPGAAESFTTGCQITVGDETELTRAREMGYWHSPAEALADFEVREKLLSTTAAHRAHEDRNMSAAAKAEAAEVEASTAEHVGEVPRKRTVKKRRTASKRRRREA